MTQAAGRAALALLVATVVAVRATAQQTDPRLERLDAAARAVVAAMVDSARAAGLPANPLVERALEGVTKGASGEVIAGAVRRLLGDLGRARQALGLDASATELDAGAAALRAGAGPDVLARLRHARRDQSATVPLSVLTDLVSGGVPVDTAVAAVLTLTATARDEELVEFRRAVERDIALGAPPAAAASVRLNSAAREARPGRP